MQEQYQRLQEMQKRKESSTTSSMATKKIGSTDEQEEYAPVEGTDGEANGETITVT